MARSGYAAGRAGGWLALLCAMLLGAGPALAAGNEAALFVVSVPMGATVVMDGQPLPGRTPLLLRSLAAGRHELLVSASGYPPQGRQVELAAGEVGELRVELGAAFLRVVFPEETRIEAAGARENAGGRLFQLPLGGYSLRRNQGLLVLEPRYPGEGWIRGLSVALPLSVAFAAVLTAHDVYYPKRLALDLGEQLSLSPATLCAYGLSAAVGALDLALLARRARFRRSFRYASLPAEESLAAAQALYARAEDFLAGGQLPEALRAYASVMEGYPDSLLYAHALFKSARIHFLSGEDDLAAAGFMLLAERYPLPESYDKARRNLAELLLRGGRFEQCLEQLAAIVFRDEQVSREEVNRLADEAIAAWLAAEPLVPRERVQAWRRRLPGGS